MERRAMVVNREELTAQEREIALAILFYLDEHAEAKDTIEGIAQWWLLRQGSRVRPEDVERAVGWLVAQGLLLETCRVGIRPYYQRTPQGHREAGESSRKSAMGLDEL
jgi:hypothetical protein